MTDQGVIDKVDSVQQDVAGEVSEENEDFGHRDVIRESPQTKTVPAESTRGK